MIRLEARVSDHRVEGAARLLLLERLQEMGFVPLIRSTRARCFEIALSGPARVKEMERAVAAWMEAERDEPYIRGEVFFLRDVALFLIFGAEEPMRAGVVYDKESGTEPLAALEDFCRRIDEALIALRRAGEIESVAAEGWRKSESPRGRGWDRFVERARASAESLKGSASQAVALMANEDVRRLLRRLREGIAEGRAVADEGQSDEAAVAQLAEAGLLRREIVIVCRREGRALFRLPSPGALNLIMTSNAVCSECGAAVADEKVEERVALTEQASMWLDSGAWLALRIQTLLRDLGISEDQAAIALMLDGDVQALIEAHRERFLLFAHDGDFALQHARQALDALIESEADHLLVVATGRITQEARARLRDYARRRGVGELVLAEGFEAALVEIRHAFDRAAQRALIAELSELDGSLGLCVGHLVWTRFRMAQKGESLRDVAESAIGAVVGKLKDL